MFHFTNNCIAEVYDGHDCDLWQVIYLSAGTYTLECQGYYRNGTSWDEDPNTWSNGSWVNRAKLYAETGLYDIDSEEFVSSGSPFEGWLMPRLFEGVMERLFEDTDYTLNDDGSKRFAAGWDMSDGQYNQADGRWGPCSIPGSLVWFESGKYEPYDDGGVGNTTSGSYFNWWTAAAGDIELWENKNVEFYAKAGEKEEVSYITSICSSPHHNAASTSSTDKKYL